MPEVAPAEMELLRLWTRCKAFNRLPMAGGILEQPAWLMDAMDEIETTAQKVRAKAEEDERMRVEKERLMGKLGA